MEQHEAPNGQGVAPEETPQVEHPNNNNEQNMATLLESEAFRVELPQQGEVREGIIASIQEGQILVSIGAKSEGVIAGREYDQIPAEERESFEVGQRIPVYVLNPEDANGNVVLSYTRALEQIAWDHVERMLEEKQVIESTISGYNKGGLIVMIEGLRGFVPASQVSTLRRSIAVGDTPEQRWGKMVGEPIAVRIIEVDRNRRRLILSERAASDESRQAIKERVIEELEVGKTYRGRVTSLANFGAFVNIRGADGLIHLSELSWERVEHPREVLEVGQEVDVKVISIDKERKRIGLSLRQLTEDPWKEKLEKYRVGQLVEGVITRLTKFGAFARLENDIEGLIHISEISEEHIEHPKEVLKVGDVVTLRIIRIDTEQRRIGLSLRKVDSPAYADRDLKALARELKELELGKTDAEAESLSETDAETETTATSPETPQAEAPQPEAKTAQENEETTPPPPQQDVPPEDSSAPEQESET
ncbi:MAG: S1 RNA-binding domain-containing protein [Anaerolineae bacterium]|nr:MAG: S1 RNA-binding domain-containing protein [Anaerolineae bacterium]